MKRCKILILDDLHDGDEQLRDAVGLIHDVVWVRTILQAMEQLSIDPLFDLIICGVHLQNESMFAFLKEVKSIGKTKDIPFLPFRAGDSAFAKACDSQIAGVCRLLGAADYLKSNSATLLTEIEAAIAAPASVAWQGTKDVSY